MIILYTNADIFMNKRDELDKLVEIQDIKPHIIAITEVKYKTKK